MASSEIREYFDFIASLTREAGKVVVEGFYDVKKVETKGNVSYDLVTDSDKKVEDLIVSGIKKKYSGHVIIGEESWTPGENPELTDSPTWIIDPIDGTINFIKGIPLIGISVALAVNKEVVLGIVYNPVVNEFFSAIKGEGAYCNGKRIYSSKNEDLKKAVVSNELSLASIPFLHERTLQRVKKITQHGVLGFRCLGSAAVTLCYLANGSLDAYFTDGLKCWDIAAGILILEEAGGCASCPDGSSLNMFSGVLLTAGNQVLLKKMVEILTECDAQTSKFCSK